jgi:hypothetical protein
MQSITKTSTTEPMPSSLPLGSLMVEALIVVVPNPDLVTLSYPKFSEVLTKVNTTLANAYSFTCEKQVEPIYINDMAYTQINEVLTAIGTYEIPDINWSPTYLDTKACPTVVIRVWYEIFNNPTRRLQSSKNVMGLPLHKEQEITNNLRYNVVPLLQTGQYDIQIMLNGKSTLIETVKVINLEQQQKEFESMQISKAQFEQQQKTNMFGGIFGAVGFVTVVGILAAIVRKRYQKKEAKVEKINMDNPMKIGATPVNTNFVQLNRQKLESYQVSATTYRNSVATKLPGYAPSQVRKLSNGSDSANLVSIPSGVSNGVQFYKTEFKPMKANGYQNTRELNIDIEKSNAPQSFVHKNNSKISETNIYRERQFFPAQLARPSDRKVNKVPSENSNELIKSVEKINTPNPLVINKQIDPNLQKFSVYQSANKNINNPRSGIKSIRQPELVRMSKK